MLLTLFKQTDSSNMVTSRLQDPLQMPHLKNRDSPPFSDPTSLGSSTGWLRVSPQTRGCASSAPLLPPQEGDEVAVEVGQAFSPGVSGHSVFFCLFSVLVTGTPARPQPSLRSACSPSLIAAAV